jgi:hypothetical protein
MDFTNITIDEKYISTRQAKPPILHAKYSSLIGKKINKNYMGVGILYQNKPVFYPLHYLCHHEVIQESSLWKTTISITYCPNTRSAVAYFGRYTASTKTYHNNTILVNKENTSEIIQLIRYDMKNKKVINNCLSGMVISLIKWREMFPNTILMSGCEFRRKYLIVDSNRNYHLTIPIELDVKQNEIEEPVCIITTSDGKFEALRYSEWSLPPPDQYASIKQNKYSVNMIYLAYLSFFTNDIQKNAEEKKEKEEAEAEENVELAFGCQSNNDSIIVNTAVQIEMPDLDNKIKSLEARLANILKRNNIDNI